MDTAVKVHDIIQHQLDVEDFSNESHLQEDLNADSLDLIELTMALEEAFDIDIPDEDAEKLNTVGDVVKYVEGKKK